MAYATGICQGAQLKGTLAVSYLLIDDHDGFTSWAKKVYDLIGDLPTESDPRLADFYRGCLETAR